MMSRSKLVFQVGVAQLLEKTLEHYIGPWSEQPDLITYDAVERVLNNRVQESDDNIDPDWANLPAILLLMEKRRELLGKPSLWPMLISKGYEHPIDCEYWQYKCVAASDRSTKHRAGIQLLLGVAELPSTLETLFE